MAELGSEPVHDPERLGFDTARLRRLKSWMQRYVDDGRWPGGAALVASHGELAYFESRKRSRTRASRPSA